MTANRSTEQRTCAVVVTYNRKALLARCIECLQAQSESGLDILVVDNASTDGTAQMLSALILTQPWPSLFYMMPSRLIPMMLPSSL